MTPIDITVTLLCCRCISQAGSDPLNGKSYCKSVCYSFFYPFTPKFVHLTVPIHQSVLRSHTTATNWGGWGQLHASNNTCEPCQVCLFTLLLFAISHNTIQVKLYLPSSTYSSSQIDYINGIEQTPLYRATIHTTYPA